MDEAEWLKGTDPTPMLRFLETGGGVSDRKLRLFAVACCRRVRSLMRAKESQNVLEATERFADGLASREEFCEARLWMDELDVEVMSDGRRVFAWATKPDERPIRLAVEAARYAGKAIGPHGNGQAVLSRLLRDIFGNPFQTSVIDSNWLTHSVVTLAQSIYNERSFERLPLLGDALEAAGCDNSDMLSHCRTKTEHVKGCWVVDAFSGRA
jgi:hypothetical protein